MTNSVRCGIMNSEDMYVVCPNCGKKLFRVIKESQYNKIFVWCKNCKKEIEINKEPVSQK